MTKKSLLFVATLAALAGAAKAEILQIDDVEFFLDQYAITHALGVDYCCSDLIRQTGTGCISGGNSLVVRSQSQDGLLLNYDVGVVRTSVALAPHGADLGSSTLAWDFYMRADGIYDIAKFQVLARQGGAEYTLPGVFEPPSFGICYRWTGNAALSDFLLVRGAGSNGARLDLRVGAAPIAIGWRVFQDAHPWQTFFARPKVSNSHFTFSLVPVGACCAPDGGCSVGTASGCASSGGIYHGDGTVCDPNPCPQPPPTGACCATDGTCSSTTSDACLTAGGSYQGDQSTCNPNPCPQPTRTGACCVRVPRLGSLCLVIPEAFCNRFPTGTYLGDGVLCRPVNPCQQELTENPDADASSTGACCLAGADCTPLSARNCALLGGEFLGVAANCELGCSATAVATTRVTWGAVKSRYQDKPVR